MDNNDNDAKSKSSEEWEIENSETEGLESEEVSRDLDETHKNGNFVKGCHICNSLYEA